MTGVKEMEARVPRGGETRASVTDESDWLRDTRERGEGKWLERLRDAGERRVRT